MTFTIKEPVESVYFTGKGRLRVTPVKEDNCLETRRAQMNDVSLFVSKGNLENTPTTGQSISKIFGGELLEPPIGFCGSGYAGVSGYLYPYFFSFAPNSAVPVAIECSADPPLCSDTILAADPNAIGWFFDENSNQFHILSADQLQSGFGHSQYTRVLGTCLFGRIFFEEILDRKLEFWIYLDSPCIYGFLHGMSFNAAILFEAIKLPSQFNSMFECAKEVFVNYPTATAAQMTFSAPSDCYAISANVSNESLILRNDTDFMVCFLKGYLF